MKKTTTHFKTILLTLSLLLISSFSFAAHASVATTGDGTKDNPYTVADVKEKNQLQTDGNKYWVKGFIVGTVVNGDADGNLTGLHTPDKYSNTNLALANSADEEDLTRMISVQLPTEKDAPGVREGLNLKDNPHLLGLEVLVYGTLEKYFNNVPGVKNVTEYEFADGTNIPSAVATPVILPSSGTFSEPQVVSISTATEGAKIYFTTDGSTPTESSTPYTAAFTVSETTTILAKAFKADMNPSAIATAIITIKEPVETQGDGSEGNPYSIADVKAMNNQDADGNKYWVKGFIIGTVQGGGNDGNVTNLHEDDKYVASNIALADAADEDDLTKIIAVELKSASSVRAALNVVDNPENLGQEVMVYGTLEKYFNAVPGVKNVTDYKIGDLSAIDNIRANIQIWSSEGMIYFQANAGETVELYNLAGQKMQTHIASDGVNTLTLNTTGVVIVKAGDRVSKVILK